VLKQSQGSVPCGQDIERGLSSIPQIIDGKGPNHAISVSEIRAAIFNIKKAATYNYKDFALTRHESMMIQTEEARPPRLG